MHDFLAGQGIAYAIYIIQQDKEGQFNRGMLFNVGFREALRDFDNFCCFIFHDVDLLPENPQVTNYSNHLVKFCFHDDCSNFCSDKNEGPTEYR